MASFNRREFLKRGAIAGAGLSLFPQIVTGTTTSKSADISVATGKNAFNTTLAAIELSGGITKFVPRGSKVGLLINAPEVWNKPGSYTHTDVVLATLKLLSDNGISDIRLLNDLSPDFYKRSKRSAEFDALIKQIKKSSGTYEEFDNKNGVSMKKPRIIKDLFACDILINIPINKQHAGTNMTNCLKNFMGLCHQETNQYFHFANGAKEYYDDVEHLSQCIADVNLIRKPDLCISDATEVLKTNGPFGPGEIIKPNKVFVGADPVAMDSYGSTILGNKPEEIRMIAMASKHGLGRMDLANFTIMEKQLNDE
jgi:uncharacterized protein (DUF362 family)